ncbi:hypothetical protein ACO0LM_19820 [Undibacterium sp. Di26W]|uniref:hypothetical protein n=1 Tax=Undibacterium sp. Di26W TaxID=3413035 RepID=UPI003BEF6F79
MDWKFLLSSVVAVVAGLGSAAYLHPKSFGMIMQPILKFLYIVIFLVSIGVFVGVLSAHDALAPFLDPKRLDDVKKALSSSMDIYQYGYFTAIFLFSLEIGLSHISRKAEEIKKAEEAQKEKI